jgi:hypothetical protein
MTHLCFQTYLRWNPHPTVASSVNGEDRNLDIGFPLVFWDGGLSIT